LATKKYRQQNWQFDLRPTLPSAQMQKCPTQYKKYSTGEKDKSCGSFTTSNWDANAIKAKATCR
jgi:hypothetical protein